MNKMHVASIIFLITLSLLIIPQATTSSDPSVHFDSSPTTTWYTNAPYRYVATISSPYNWTLKTDATLHMSDGNVVNDTASQTIFGILATGSYWVNISISYHHPHVVTVFDVSETNGRPFIVMELVEGGTLASLMRSQKLSVDRAVEIVRQVLSALEFAHESGILHRDIKPSNILMGNNGQAKVSDFGIATILDSAGELDLTMTSGVIGTPAYLSPERAEGSKEITPASDLFSVGVILYEMLTGQKPFSGESPLAVLLAAKSGKFQAPEQLNPEIPPYVSQVIKRSLSPSPQERYLSAAQMAAALDPNYVMESTVGFSGFGMPLSQVDSGLSDERTQVWVAAEAGSRMGSDPTIVESGSGGLGAGRLARDGLAGAGIIGFLLLVKNRCLELAGKLNSYFRDEVSPKTRAALGLAALAIAGFIVASILFFGHGGSGGRATTPTTSIVTTTTSTSTTTTSTTSTTVVPTTIVPTTVPPGPARSGPPGFLKKGH